MQHSFSTTKQRGGVLIVSLVFLLIMTVLGLSATGSANLELRMAGNAKDISIAMQAAESATEAFAEVNIENKKLLGSMIGDTEPTVKNIRLDSAYDLDSQPVTSQASISYIGEGDAEGYGMSVETGWVAYHFELQGTGSVQGNIVAANSQGVRVIFKDVN
ncbi:MAG: PilX N-terminal domain-containing pilus assembly protein [Gammaproteobacteria bacterium]|jgi:Tfp pilus assembly protein PilX